ncbi:hypothetical protein BJX64DRAFT_292372 [Aspergillus heterothallicus]
MANRAQNQRPPMPVYQPSWFDIPQGKDEPQQHLNLAADAFKRRICYITIDGYDTAWTGGFRLDLDSQQPAIHLNPQNGVGPTLVFPIQNAIVECHIEGDHKNANDVVQRHRKKFEFFSTWGWKKVIYYALSVLEEPLMTFGDLENAEKDWSVLYKRSWKGTKLTIWREQKDTWNTWPHILAHLRLLQQRLQLEPLEPGVIRLSCWYYRTWNPPNDRAGPQPPPRWLFSKDRTKPCQFTPWEPRVPFFVDFHEYSRRMSKAYLKEMDAQRRQITDVYNKERFHRACIVTVEGSTLQYMQITLGENPEQAEANAPQIFPGTEVKFAIAKSTDEKFRADDLHHSGEVVEFSTPDNLPADLVVLVKDHIEEIFPNGFLIVAAIKPNLTAINEQMLALKDCETLKSFGDHDDNIKKGRLGFSLTRTLLAHGTELIPGNPNHFVMDAVRLDPPLHDNEQPLSIEERQRRIDFILKCFPLDIVQMEAFDGAVRSLTCGVKLIQGPPGTGKTTISVVIIIVYAALQHNVMLAAGSNGGTDKLAEDVVKALEKHKEIRRWTGDLIRLRTPSFQFSSIRASDRSAKPTSSKTTASSAILEDHQMHRRVLRYAEENPIRPDCQTLLRLLQIHRVGHLTRDQFKGLNQAYQKICKTLFCSCRIVATTLNNAASEIFRYGYQPDFLVCDDSGQCLEGDVAIALRLQSLRGLILIGDPKQPVPTIISEHQQNEGARYLLRSLLERLMKAGYPFTMLESHYRCHPEIMDFPNREIYNSRLVNKFNPCTKVGYIWHEFTRQHHHFYGNGLENLRRLFVSVDTDAFQPPNSCSWQNLGQANVLCDFLRALYSFRAPNGMTIQSSDVMVISPYREQRILVEKKLRDGNLRVRANLTVDGAQGQEAAIVFFLMVKPSETPRSVGILAGKSRLNVALTRPKDLLVILGNLKVWNEATVKKIKISNHRNRMLSNLLLDVSAKGHTLTWNGPRTVTETQAPANVKYPCHDQHRKQRVYDSQTRVPALRSSTSAPATPKPAASGGLGESMHAVPKGTGSGALKPGWNKIGSTSVQTRQEKVPALTPTEPVAEINVKLPPTSRKPQEASAPTPQKQEASPVESQKAPIGSSMHAKTPAPTSSTAATMGSLSGVTPRLQKERLIEVLNDQIRVLEKQLDYGIDVSTAGPLTDEARDNIEDTVADLTGKLTKATLQLGRM